MGNQLVRAVSNDWGHLPAGPFKLLVRMATYALDQSTDPERPAAHYWRGWKHLSEGLGRTPPNDHDNSEEAKSARKWMTEEVRRHTAALVKAGAVSRAVDNPGFGTRQVWRLTVTRPHDL